jgi:hypothetical protein
VGDLDGLAVGDGVEDPLGAVAPGGIHGHAEPGPGPEGVSDREELDAQGGPLAGDERLGVPLQVRVDRPQTMTRVSADATR